jgi:hypothetical protein
MVMFPSFTCRPRREDPPPPKPPPKRPCPVPLRAGESQTQIAGEELESQRYWAQQVEWLDNYLKSEACTGGTFDSFLELDIIQPLLVDLDAMAQRIEQADARELTIEEIANIGETHARLFALVSAVLQRGRNPSDTEVISRASSTYSSLLSAEGSTSYVNKLFRAFLKATGEIYNSCRSGELASADRERFGRHHVLLAYDVLHEIWETYQSYVNHRDPIDEAIISD